MNALTWPRSRVSGPRFLGTERQGIPGYHCCLRRDAGEHAAHLQVGCPGQAIRMVIATSPDHAALDKAYEASVMMNPAVEE